jgi:hypothetical protein
MKSPSTVVFLDVSSMCPRSVIGDLGLYSGRWQETLQRRGGCRRR